MSYSINARGADVAAALQALATEFDTKVVAQQPTHAKDREQALAAAAAFLALLAPSPDKDVSIAMNGSLSWSSNEEFTWVNFGVSGGYVPRAADQGSATV